MKSTSPSRRQSASATKKIKARSKVLKVKSYLKKQVNRDNFFSLSPKKKRDVLEQVNLELILPWEGHIENLMDYETMFHMGEGLPKMIESNAVGVCEDSEIKRTCLDLTSMKTAPSCKLSFHIEKDLSEMPYLCVYMKHVDAFTGFDLYLSLIHI